MRSAIGKLEQETTQQQENNNDLKNHLDTMRRLVVNHFQGITLPKSSGDTTITSSSASAVGAATSTPPDDSKLTMDTVDDFIARLRTLFYEKSEENEPLLAKARDIAKEIDYSQLSLES